MEFKRNWSENGRRWLRDMARIWFLRQGIWLLRINEPYDPKVVSSLLALIKIYGEEVVTEVIDKVTSLSFENGKWEMRYIVGILQCDYSPLQ